MNINLADTKYEKPISKIKKPTDYSKVLIVLIFVGIFAWGGFLTTKRTLIIRDNHNLEKSIETISESIKTLMKNDSPAKKIAVVKTLNKIGKTRILWSEVMAKIIKLEIPGISFYNFSVSKEGVVDATLSTKNFDMIQKFIVKLNNNEEVEKIVINSIRLEDSAIGKVLEVSIKFNLKI